MADPSSPLAEALARVGDRWTLLVVEALLEGPRRFSELGEQVEGIAPNILSQRLKHLEREGLVLTEPYTDRPPRYEYRLTAPGKELADALRALSQWGAQHSEAESPGMAPADPSRGPLVVPHLRCGRRPRRGRPPLRVTVPLDPETLRPSSPRWDALLNGRQVAYLDGPGGTQVPKTVIEAMADYLRQGGATSVVASPAATPPRRRWPPPGLPSPI